MYSKSPSDIIFHSLIEDQMFALLINLVSFNVHNCDESKKKNTNHMFDPYFFSFLSTHLMNMLHFVKQSLSYR